MIPPIAPICKLSGFQHWQIFGLPGATLIKQTRMLFHTASRFCHPLPRSRGSDIFCANGSTNCGDGPSVPMARSYRNDDGKAEGKSKKAKVKRKKAEARVPEEAEGRLEGRGHPLPNRRRIA